MSTKTLQPRDPDSLAIDVLIARVLAGITDIWVESDGDPKGTLPDGRRVSICRYSSTYPGMGYLFSLLKNRRIPFVTSYEPEDERDKYHKASLRGGSYTGESKFAPRALAKAVVQLIRTELEPLEVE